MSKSTLPPLIVALLAALSFQSSLFAQTLVQPRVTIKEVMESVITPASDTLWAADDPTTDEEWQQLEHAAISMIVASALIDIGGAGPMDNEWVREPAWRAFSKVMTDASVASLQAIRNKDFNALLEAGNVLYPPCEGCHLQFNPGVVNQ